MTETNPLRKDAGPSALGHLRVLDLTDPSGQYCTKLLGDLGADVIKVEPPEGDPSRHLAPFAGGIAHGERSLRFLSLNSNKRSVVLDLASEADRGELRQLVRGSDVLVETFAPGYMEGLGLGFQALASINPGLVMTSITPFGQTGPYRNYLGGDLIAQAMGGLMYMQGDDEKPPCMAPAEQAFMLASLHAAFATLVALEARRRKGSGQHVDVSMQDVVAHLLFILVRYATTGEIVRRHGKAATNAPNGYYLAKDGYVGLHVVFEHHWRVLVDWMANEVLAEPVWEDANFRRQNSDIVDEGLAEFISDFTVREFVEEAQARHLAAIPVNSPTDFVESPHTKARGFFLRANHPILGEHALLGAPYRFSETPWRLTSSAPLLGQHQQEVFKEQHSPLVQESSPPAVRNDSQRRSNDALPLEGIRVVDFTRVWAGPLGTRYMADFGAEVIKVETQQYVEAARFARGNPPQFPENNRGKLGITVDFQRPEGRELIQRLVKESDVVVDNFAAGVLERHGLGYQQLRKLKPDIIALSMAGFGNDGPYADYVSYGLQLLCHTGMSYLWGHPGSPQDARIKIAYPDFMSGINCSLAVMAALEYRARTGRGQYIEISQTEALASTMGVPLLEKLINGLAQEPSGNFSPNASPHDCYPCLGEDMWCAIACWNDDQWHSLCQAMDGPTWAEDDKFVDLEGRLRHREELDEKLAQWTRSYTPHQVMRMLQKVGVPAGVVQTGEHLYHDPHLRARGFLISVDHPGWGRLEQPGLTAILSETPGRVSRGMSELGEHNRYVVSDLLGLSAERFEELVEQKVIY